MYIHVHVCHILHYTHNAIVNYMYYVKFMYPLKMKPSAI